MAVYSSLVHLELPEGTPRKSISQASPKETEGEVGQVVTLQALCSISYSKNHRCARVVDNLQDASWLENSLFLTVEEVCLSIQLGQHLDNQHVTH